MNEGINLIMPMGGSGSRFSERGFDLPKPLIMLQGRPFFYWATRSIEKYTKLKSLTFVVLQEHINKFKIDIEIKKYFPDAQIRVLGEVLNGAVLTCLEGVKAIDNDAPIVFNDCDHLFYCEKFYDYCNKGDYTLADGALLTFRSNDPKFSFLELDANGNVINTVEKAAVSEHAICGAYYFKNKTIFEKSSKIYLTKCAYKEFFVSGVYNELAKIGGIIHNYDVNMHLAFGTPEEYDLALTQKGISELL
ncbi:MAG: glycosyltransferase family 2 protein [Oscillospiraceae bacterium]